jgi:hypothetical protein
VPEEGRCFANRSLRAKWGEKILAQAKATRDAATFNAVAHLYLGTDKLPEIDQLGWEATGDERFAASLLVGLAGKGNLKLDDPRLVRATKQFPENSEIARIVVMLTRQAGKPLKPALVNGIKAEYSHFSLGSPTLRAAQCRDVTHLLRRALENPMNTK